jgi:hypothetical protein
MVRRALTKCLDLLPIPALDIRGTPSDTVGLPAGFDALKAAAARGVEVTHAIKLDAHWIVV